MTAIRPTSVPTAAAVALDHIARRLDAFAVFQDRPGAMEELELIASEVRTVASALITMERAPPTSDG